MLKKKNKFLLLMYHTKIQITQIHYKLKVRQEVKVKLHSRGKGHYRLSQLLDREV